jgi:mono/diheme cytochrome c family protein
VKSDAHSFAIVNLVAAAIAAGAAHTFAADLAAAKSNYSQLCAVCHGEAGHGDGPGPAKASRPAYLRDFADCVAMAQFPDSTLFKSIKEGGASVGLSKAMPPGKDIFNDDQIADLVAYVRGFCKR